MCQPVPRFWADTRYGLPPGQGAGLGEPLVWPYRDQFRGMNTTHLLSSICKAAPTTRSSQVKESELLPSECGLAHLLVTGADTTVFPIPVLVALGQLQRASFSAYLQWKVFGVFLGKQHVPWNVKNVPVWISTRCCRPVQPCFALEHGQNGTDLQYISWVTYGGWMSFLPTAV